jgi:hypothetical protein
MPPRAAERAGHATLAPVPLSDQYRRNAYSGSALMTPRAELPSVHDFLPLRPVEALVLTMLSTDTSAGSTPTA